MSSDADTGCAALPQHLYVHVPLCRSKCSYCDFYSLTPDALDGTPADLAQLLADQALAWFDRGLERRPLKTLYVGGGTPTMLGPALASLVAQVIAGFGVAGDAEVTVEANPDSADEALLEMLAEVGVTRISLGVQSFDDEELRLLGRPHDAGQASIAAGRVRAAGLTLAVDLMCGLPGQSRQTWTRTLERAVEAGAEHVSVYPLSLEAGTPMAAAVLVGDLPEPDDDAAVDAMLEAGAVLGAAGLSRYEVANYALPGCASQHNIAYWTGREYLGAGPGAHGMLTAATARTAGFAALSPATARVRYSVVADLEEGLSRTPRVDVESLGAPDAAREDAMLGMRLVEGIAEALADRAGVRATLESLESEGLVYRAGGRWATTERGWLLGNEVFGRIWNTGTV